MSLQLASSETVIAPPSINPLMSVGNWIYRFILFPLGQMTVFIVGAAVILTLFSYGLALLFPEPRPGINLAAQISTQLPGMIITGISIGFVYSMIALGYTLVYGVLKFINFAHSEMFMVGSVIGFEVMRRVFDEGHLGAWAPVLLVLVTVLLSMLFSGTLAVVIERVAYRPLRGAPRLVPLITAIGISYILIDSTRAIMTLTRNDFNLTYPTNEIDWLNTPIPVSFQSFASGGTNFGGQLVEQINADGADYESFRIGDVTYENLYIGGITIGGKPIKNTDLRTLTVGESLTPEAIEVNGQPIRDLIEIANVVNIRITSIIVVISAVLMLLVLNFFVNGTKLGRGIRAVSQDQATAGLMGINVNRMVALTFFIGGAFGGGAGALFGMNAGTVTPYVGFIPGIKAFTAAVLGGIGNVTGALLGGLTLGLIESFLNGILVYFPALGQRYTDIFAFSVLIFILIFRPSGILGERVDEKV